MDVNPSKLQIVLYPNPILRAKALPVDPADPRVRAVVAQMIQLMHVADGIGLAAPQVGLPWRLFVINATGQDGGERAYLNPRLTDPSRDLATYNEGCLSLPNIHADIPRPKGITLHALDLDGNPVTESSTELPARVWQHEFDHLNGVLLIDRMGQTDKIANRAAIKELEAAAGLPHKKKPLRK